MNFVPKPYGMDTYFKYLPMITQTIDDSIESMKKIVVEIPNKCDIRFEKLKEIIKELSRIK